MLTIEKQKPEDVVVTKLVITTPKDALDTPKVSPKKLKTDKQDIQPAEEQNTESLFIIY